MKRILKGILALFLILASLFSIVGCADENVIDNISSDGISSVAGSEEISSASKSEQSNNDDKSKPSQNTSQISSKTEDKSSTSSKFKRPTSSAKSSSKKTSSVYERDTSLYMMDYIFRNKIYKDEYYNRGGLYNTLYKLQNGEDITIAYLGGSITEMKGWRYYTTKWFEDNYSGKVTEVEIAISSTGADLGVCRIDNEVLVHNPDLVFIEYAVNGGAAKDMEGMVLKTWNHDPTTDICFVYTTLTSSYSTYQVGNLPKYAETFEGVAKHYNIPSVFFGKQAFDMYEKGKLVLTGEPENPEQIVYSNDGTHPTEEGGHLAAGAVARSVRNMEKNFDKNSYSITKHTIPSKNYMRNPWVEATTTAEWSKMKFEGNWFNCPLKDNGQYENYNYNSNYLFKRLFDNMQGTKEGGASVTIKFKGTDIGLIEASGQYSGQLRVIVDGKETNKLVLFNQQNSKGIRQRYFFISSLPYGEHTVTFILDTQMPDKSLMQSKYPDDKTYERNELYIGKILLNGELLDANK